MFALFEGLTNVFILSIATLLLALAIAFYCSTYIKHLNEKHQKKSNRITMDGDNAGESEAEEGEELSEGFMSKLNIARLKEFESTLTEDQIEEEKRVESEQLAAIFELLKRQEAELNMKEIDESELKAQLGLYR